MFGNVLRSLTAEGNAGGNIRGSRVSYARNWTYDTEDEIRIEAEVASDVDSKRDWGGSKVLLMVKGRALGWAAVPCCLKLGLG